MLKTNHTNHQVAGIYDGQTGKTMRLHWDSDGQLSSIYGPCFEDIKQHKWNEAGELVACYGNSGGGFYGYDYFGARYYDSQALAGWLSVDPLADKYPHISSYAYCAWNPLKYFDEHGLKKKNFFNAEVNNP